MAICPASSEHGVVYGLLDTVDCHIRTLAQQSYRDLVGPDTMFAAAFTGLLTIYIALIGYQLLLGRGGLRVMDLPLSALKIGLILAFLTSWAAYQTVIFGLLFDGPREIMVALLSPMAKAGGGFDGDLYGGLERAFGDLSGAASVYGGQASPAGNILQGGPMLGSGILWFSAIAMLMATVGLILVAKIVLAFLLAVGPIFVGLFLFDTTRGFFDGWLRTTVAFALAPIATHVFGAAMLMMLQPFLARLVANASTGVFDMGLIITIGLTVAVFAIVLGFSVRLGIGIASGYSSARREPSAPPQGARERDGRSANMQSDRAEEVAARAALSERNRDVEVAASGGGLTRRVAEIGDAVGDPVTPLSMRLGQTYRRAPVPASGGPEEGR
jgi:type IV secretion system protein VirB6